MKSKSSLTRGEQQVYYTKEKENIDSNREMTQIYGKSCFHVAHEDAIRKALDDN